MCVGVGISRSRADGLPAQYEFEVNLGDKPFVNQLFLDLGFSPVHNKLFTTSI